MTAYETYAAAAVGTLTLIDEFARERRTRGLMPAPIPPLRFSLIAHEDSGNMIPLDPSIVLDALSGPSGAYLFADNVLRITPGTYRLRIESDFYQTLEADLAWPAVPPPPLLLLQPGFGYPFPDVTVAATKLTLLRGGVLSEVGGTPIADAVVELLDPPNLGPLATSKSDARGAWVLAVSLPATPPNQSLKLQITPPGGGGVIVVPDVKVSPTADNSLAQTALRGSVLTTGGSPIAGAEITVDVVPGKSVRSGRDGGWAFYFGLNEPDGAAQVNAKAPNGVVQSQDVQIFNRKTMVVPTFRFAMS